MTETMFWLITALMMLVSIAIFVLPIYRGKDQDEEASRDELNKAFFRDRMEEIEEEAQEGLIENQGELAVELKQSLLDDIPTQQAVTERMNTVSAMMLAPGVLILVILSYFLYNTFGSYGAVVSWQETTNNLPELSQRLMSESQEPLTDQEMADLTLALRTKLQQTPDDAMGWLLLGRIGMANRDIQTAEGAMAKAYGLSPENSDIKLGYAQSLIFSGDETNVTKARGLLREVIREDHANMQAFSLLAFEAFERGAYDEAIAAWSTMKKLLPENDPRIAMLERSIARANTQMNVGSGQKVSVTVTLDEDVVLPEQGVLIVSVHSADGAPMPIAAKRLPINQFPLTVELTDADSMIPERLMSSLPEVLVKARIDHDGNVMTKDGDWFGETLPFALGGQSQVVINQKY
ncbi:c-type cytochrome biogenesis protein CcmI [Enterovibrio norvegicus]|uniref:Cytochrome c-type biogenesis protein CcmI n=1 Tax=Enterovibrio norvegicus DSM 15893 TaxID=1121869 RepID=A0A1I5N759_9GAMM|nr:c-type cytochrome biogenesis protein CcmI [Enterovibrio norvegicus]SFP17136.1 cytochrome c-type biogenesis protein CcmI [Enterovibrio norvegicus DSM 15893]